MGVYRLLHQNKVWVDRNEVEHQIADMEPRYCANVVRFLQRRHDEIGTHVLLDLVFLPMPSGAAAFDEVDRCVQAEQDQILFDSLTWLNGTPLMVALSKRAAEVSA